MLTFELYIEPDKRLSELDVCFDPQGAALLIQAVQQLATKSKDDHDHLMAPGWAGTELAETPLDPAATLLNHVRLVFRTEPWSDSLIEAVP